MSVSRVDDQLAQYHRGLSLGAPLEMSFMIRFNREERVCLDPNHLLTFFSPPLMTVW